MYIFLMIIHVIVCLVLIAVILLQAGRGGGFSEALGSSQPSTILGTQSNVFMRRATEVCAIVFIITSLSLGILSTRRGKSLMEKEMLLHEIQKQTAAQAKLPEVPKAPEVPKPAENVPTSTQAS